MTTQRRLKKLLQQPSVWEGDRRSLTAHSNSESANQGNSEECIVWVDRSEGCVRAMEVVSSDTGPEAIVRTLIRAMETPMGPVRPGRPQKILVRNREVQFFLRGALQSLNITIEYEPELPLIDELFRTFEESQSGRPPAIPPRYSASLKELSQEVWQHAPWQYIADYEIIAVDLKQIYSQTLYVCILGMSEQEYGLIFYRSLDSLKRFRQAALDRESMSDLEQIFLSQDCWFLNYEAAEDWDFDEDDEDEDLGDLDSSDIEPILGSLHPYEGLRRFLDEEEAGVIYVTLQALLRFFQTSKRQLEKETVVSLSKTYNLPLFPVEVGNKEQVNNDQQMISVTVSTQPEISQELLQMLEEIDDDDDDDYNDDDDDYNDDDESRTLNVPIDGELIPDNSWISLELMSWKSLAKLLENPKTYSDSFAISAPRESLPVVVIQTTRPKAKEIIETLQEKGGLKSVCLYPVDDYPQEFGHELGILHTNDGNLYIFNEFDRDDPEYRNYRQNWSLACQETQGRCGLIIAMGVTGSSSGKPQLQDMLGLFDAQFLEDIREIAQGILPHSE